MASYEVGVVAARSEANLLALRLVGDRQAELASLGTDLCLGQIAERQDGMGQRLGLDGEEEVRLILGRIGGSPELCSALRTDDPRIVPGGHPLRAELASA